MANEKIALDYAEEEEWLVHNADISAAYYRQLASVLVREEDRTLIDLGCGAAGMAVAFTESAPQAVVCALDEDLSVLEMARAHIKTAGLGITFARFDMETDALETVIRSSADVIWCGHVIHHARDQQEVVNRLADSLSPGGRLAIEEGGIAARFLPWDIGIGQPGLEVRLAAAGSARMAAENVERGVKPMPYGWNVALREAGLDIVSEIATPVVHPAPLNDTALINALEVMAARVGWFRGFLADDDRHVWDRLLDRRDPKWLGHRKDLFHHEIKLAYIGEKRGTQEDLRRASGPVNTSLPSHRDLLA